jgi:hypothetical protein
MEKVCECNSFKKFFYSGRGLTCKMGVVSNNLFVIISV